MRNKEASISAFTGIEAEIWQRANEWMDAVKERNETACERILGHEFALMANSLGTMPKAAWLELLPRYIIHSDEFSDVAIHVYGNGETAVMRSRYTMRATVAGQDRSGPLLMTDVWVKRDGRWQVVARHTCSAPA